LLIVSGMDLLGVGATFGMASAWVRLFKPASIYLIPARASLRSLLFHFGGSHSHCGFRDRNPPATTGS